MTQRPSEKTSGAHVWFLALRPKTLPAAVAPVLVGSALASAHQRFYFPAALAAMAVALLLQIAVNLANDYFDFKAGIDTDQRLGPVRVTQSGLISPERVKIAVIAVLVMAAFVGLYLVCRGGWPIAAVGIAAMVSALGYSGGPYPLASHGLADVFVFFFFGPVAVAGTYFVQALSFSWQAVVVSIPMGCIITAILVVNNLRDIPTDARTGKRSLAVMIGPAGARFEYAALMLGAYAAPVIVSIFGKVWYGGLLAILTLPWAILMIKNIWKETGTGLNNRLAATAKLALFYAVLQSAGLVFF